MSNTKSESLDSLQNLQLHVHVIGYHPEGECILLILYDAAKKKVSRSVLIDCFIDNVREDQLGKKMHEYGISVNNPLDLIIWTHPDSDHSLGLDKVLKTYTGDKTLIVLPEGANLITILRSGVRLAYQMMLAQLKRGVKIEHVNTSNYRKNPEEYLSIQYVDGTMDSIDFSIEILTPNGSQMVKKLEVNKWHKHNDISISMIVHCGLLDLYFGGDVENNAIKTVPTYKMAEVSFIKIPHHGSKSSTYLINVMKENITKRRNDNKEMLDITSITTCYDKGSNPSPKIEVLNAYNQLSANLYLTDNRKPRVDQYGICSFEYSVVSRTIVTRIEGDAGLYHQQ